METVPRTQHETRRRSIFLTLLAWAMMLVGLIGLPISVITALMFLAKSYGTANAGLWDSCVVVLGPLVLMVTGWGLFMRWRWALWVTIGLLVVVGMGACGKYNGAGRQGAVDSAGAGNVLGSSRWDLKANAVRHLCLATQCPNLLGSQGQGRLSNTRLCNSI